MNLERKILLGFLANDALVVVMTILYIKRISMSEEGFTNRTIDIFELVFFVLLLVLLGVVYVIIRKQIKLRLNSQTALDDNRVFMQTILDNSKTPVFIKKINGEYVFVNQTFEKLYNLKNADIIGKLDDDVMPKEIAERNRQTDLEVIKVHKEVKLEETFIVNGEERTFLSVKFPLFEPDGRIYAIGNVSTDITERKSVESSKEEGDNFFNLSLDILFISSSTKLLKFNPALSQFTGYTEEELKSKSIFDFCHPEDLGQMHKEYKALESGWDKIKLENRWICKDGTVKWLSIVATYNPKTKNFYSVAHDISSRKTNQEKLKVFEQFFNVSFDVMAVASNQYILRINPAFTNILGYEQKDIDDYSFLTLVHPDDLKTVEDELAKINKDVKMVEYVARIKCKDRTFKWLDWNVSADEDSGLLYAVARDITSEKGIKDEKDALLDQLYKSDQTLRLILENIGDGVVVANQKKEVIMTNSKTASILGIEGGKLTTVDLSNQFDIYFPDESSIYPSQQLPMDLAFKGFAVDDVDVIIVDKSTGIKKRLLMSGRPIIDQEKNIIAGVLTIKDISDYKALENELLKYKPTIGFKRESESEN